MIREISLYLLVLSLIFFLKFIFKFGVKLFQENPTPIELSAVENVLVYLSLSYIITFILVASGV